MGYWLVKTEPGEFSWDDLQQEGRTHWDGVRNYQARNHLSAMKRGDKVLVYHSVRQKAVVGVAEVVREAYPDPTAPAEDAKKAWVVVDLEPRETLPHPVTLETIKATEALAEVPLIRQSRLSVMPLSAKHFGIITRLARKPA